MPLVQKHKVNQYKKEPILIDLAIFLTLIVMLLLPSACFARNQVPDYAGRVSDFAGVISPEYNSKISSLISEIDQKTSAEIVVVTLNSISPYSESEYAQMIFDKWKIGKKGKDNGILILLAVKQRRWRIQTGYGLEGAVPDARCFQIGETQMVPYFKKRDFSQGLYYGVAAVADVIAKDAGVSLNSLQGVTLLKKSKVSTSVFVGGCIFMFLFFLTWSMPWPLYISLPFALLFGSLFYCASPLLGSGVFAGFLCSMILKYLAWTKMPVSDRKSLGYVLWSGSSGSSSSKDGSSGIRFSRGNSGNSDECGGGSSGGGGAGGGF